MTIRNMPPPLERDIQKAVVDFIGYACPHLYCFAVPNSAVRGTGHVGWWRRGRGGQPHPLPPTSLGSPSPLFSTT